MIFRAVAIWVHYTAWDTVNNTGKTGDAANHTLQVVRDGIIAAATNSPQEIGNGLYRVLLTSDEVDGLFITLGGVSSTSDIYIMPVHLTTSDDTRDEILTVQYTAWDTFNNAPKTGDDANHTLNVATANSTAAATNTPTELSAANIPGVYSLVLTADETAEPIDSVYGSSSTANIIIVPTVISTNRKYSVITDSNDPLTHRIMQVVATRLATITQLNGYKTDAGSNVQAWKDFGEGKDNYPAIYYRDIDDSADQGTIGKVDHVLTVELLLLAERNLEGSESTSLKQIREIVADVKQMVGTGTTWSDLAENTEVIDFSMDMEQLDNKQWGARINLLIEYRAERFNAYA